MAGNLLKVEDKLVMYEVPLNTQDLVLPISCRCLCFKSTLCIRLIFLLHLSIINRGLIELFIGCDKVSL